MSVLITESEVMGALRKVQDPELHRDIVSIGMIKDIVIRDEGKVAFTLELTTPACPFNEQIEAEARSAVTTLGGVKEVEMKVTSRVMSGKMGVQQDLLPGVKNVIAVASGKGGVGKSTVSVNLAASLAQSGAKVGVLDADIYGPNIPIMLGVEGKPTAEEKTNRINPPTSLGIKVMSLAFFYADDTALIWRGPMVAGAIKQFLTDVNWGDLDYLIVDLPPGTGDASLTLTQTIPLSGVVIVTTPQHAALGIATKALAMFKKLNVPIIGIVENMSYFICSHCNGRTEIFDHGGGQSASKRLDVPFLGEIPIDPEIRVRTDMGQPIVIGFPGSPSAKAFRNISQLVAGRVSVLARTELAPLNE